MRAVPIAYFRSNLTGALHDSRDVRGHGVVTRVACICRQQAGQPGCGRDGEVERLADTFKRLQKMSLTPLFSDPFVFDPFVF